MQIVFPSTEAFFAADERRRRSGEMDFGVWWRDGTFNVTYRVSAVRDTGEIYAIAMRSGPGVHEGGRVSDAYETLKWIADPTYVGNYSDSEVVTIYRKWARNALKFRGSDPAEVRPSDSRAESQAGLNGPSGSPTSLSRRDPGPKEDDDG